MSGLKVFEVKAPRDTVRRVMRTIDRGTMGVAPLPIVGQTYLVSWINALWHINGHHKLIPWKIVIHGGIDGFLRIVTFCVASNNNRAETMEQAFLQGVERFGIPSRVCF